jgi:hypothetical protein
MRSGFRPALLTLSLLLACTAAPFAHHSVAGQFDTSKSVALTGVISKVEWINPHVYLQLDVRDEGGAVTSWALATLPTAMMRRAGLTREAVQGKPGEVVTVAAIPARDESRRLAWVNKITYADGHTIQLAGQ